MDNPSLPSRERGLKFLAAFGPMRRGEVAPFAGAWIEIVISLSAASNTHVAPFAGAWIEISAALRCASRSSVAPFAGAWIEI